MTRTIVSFVAVFLFLIAPTPAWSSDATHRVAVIKGFAGPQAERIQGAVETGLSGRFAVVSDSRVAAAAQRQGVGLVGDADFARLGRALDVRAFVSAYTQKRNRQGWQVRLVVRRGDTGTPVGRLLVTGRRLDRLERTLTRQTSPRLAALVEEAVMIKAAPESEGPLQAAVYDQPEALVEDSERRPGELIEMTLDGRVFSRSFSYVQNVSRLPEYRLRGAFGTAFEATLRPGVLISDSLAGIGITGGLEYGLGVRSIAEGGSRVTNDVRGYSLGLEYRLGWGASSVAPQLGYSSSSFVTGDESGTAPNVRYRLLTGGAAGRWAFAPRFALVGRASYLHALSAGPLSEAGRFARASVRGVQGDAAVAFAITPDLEVRATGGLRRLGFDMNALPGDAWVAGGAIDQVVWGGLGLAYRP
jgi:hypothetical protein